MASKYADNDEPSAGSKYDDSDRGEAKYSGGGGASEAKGGSGPKGGDVGAILPPIVQAFAHHVMSKKYRDCVELFFKQKCGMFRGVDPKAEQLLEYTEVYQGYVGLVEEQLEDFCVRHQVTSEDVFNEVQDVARVGDLDDEFLPAILRVAEYSYFMEQMVLTADHQDHIRDAMEINDNESKSSDDELASITGVWRVDKKRTDFNGLDQYLAAIRVPAVFRGLAKGTFFSNKELLVLQRMNSISVIANSPFGWQRLDYKLDDVVHDVANPWGAEVPVRAALDMRGRDGVEVVIEHSRPAHLPRGSSVVHTWCGVDNGKALRCTMEVLQPSKETVRFELFYSRGAPGDSTAASKKKGGGSSMADAKAEAK
mmetsp:Transcript_42892/g.55109  ORF Transcript_42892/g.55109 Transcript_42892/m.55109 type:complete len:368 (-) Transcript_42892:282-1385(-)